MKRIAVGGLFYEAEPFLNTYFRMILAQDYPKDKIRLIWLYGRGQDGTLNRLKQFGVDHGSEYAEFTLFEINRITGDLTAEKGHEIAQENVCKCYNHLIELSQPDGLIIMEQDIEAPPNAIRRLLELHDKGADITAGVTLVTGGELKIAMKEEGKTFSLCGLPAISGYYLDPKGDYQQIGITLRKVNAVMVLDDVMGKEMWLDGAATGMSFLSRPLMNKLKFETNDKNSQDLYYCKRARRAGFKVLVDTGLWYEHLHYKYRREKTEHATTFHLLDSVKSDGITFKIEGGEKADGNQRTSS